MNKVVLGVFKFINETILRRSGESTALGASVITILGANIRYDLRYRCRVPLKLKSPNEVIQFPLPNRWSNDKENSKQQFFMVIKQLSLSLKTASIKEKELIEKEKDRSKANIYHMRFTHTNNIHEIKQVQKIMKIYGLHGETIYNVEREKLFAESIINGEHSYMLRAYGCNQYQLEESQPIDQAYRKQLLAAFSVKEDNYFDKANLQKAGISIEGLVDQISKENGLYSMLFEDLQRISKGDIIQNKPTIFFGRETITDTHFMQAPYPIFIKTADGSFLCIAIGYRYGIKNESGRLIGSKIQFYSPFFSHQPEKIWRLAQSHLLQALFNDFHVRVHLGLYHFTTNQYNVPLYNYKLHFKNGKKQITDKVGFNRYQTFMKHGIDIFNRGLEGVNVSATASLVHPVASYSIVNKVFNFSQQNAINLIAGYSNRADLVNISPMNLMNSQGISQEKARAEFVRIRLDMQFYDIITEYVDKVYHIFKIDEMSEGLMKQINQEIKNMGVGGQKHRPLLKSKQEVLPLLKNLVFCWSGYHAHTFSGISMANYWHFRPRMLGIPLPHDPKEWEKIEVGAEFPHTKILMEAGKLTESTTQRDADNILLDIMKEQAFLVAREVDFKLAEDESQHRQLLQVLKCTVTKLEQFGERVAEVNKQRVKDSLVLNYLAPDARQASLNI